MFNLTGHQRNANQTTLRFHPTSQNGSPQENSTTEDADQAEGTGVTAGGSLSKSTSTEVSKEVSQKH